MFSTAHASARHRRKQHPRREDLAWGPWSHARLRELVDSLRSGHPALRRGDVRLLILGSLKKEPMHGYQVIQDLEAESGGRWRPSAGSVYPTLQQLEDEGLVRSSEVDGRKVYALTDAGQSAAEARSATGPDWFSADRQDDSPDIRRLALQVVSAVMQVNKLGSPVAQRQARDILVETRRRMYRLLAEDGEVAEHGAAAAEDEA